VDEQNHPIQPTTLEIAEQRAVSEETHAPQLTPNWLFGETGLHAGWCLVVYYVLFRLIAMGLGRLVYWAIPIHASRLWSYFGGELAAFLAAVVAALIMTAIDGHKFSEYGLPAESALGRWFWIGALWGIASITVMLAGMHGAHLFDFGQVQVHGVRMLKFAVFWGAFFLLVALYEEFFFRGYLLFTLRRTLRGHSRSEEHAKGSEALTFWISAAMLCTYFGLVHLANRGESKLGIAAAACIGLFFCLTLRRTGSLWFAVGFHATWDWAQSFLYSVPDSGTLAPGHLLSSSFHGPWWLTGGSVGPEGSVLVFVVVGATAVLFEVVYGKTQASNQQPASS
jgi:membrane protease YdiL (CAAX protease family)